MLSFIKKVMPESNETKLIDVVQLWEVRWKSRYGEYSGNVQDEVDVFTSKEQAEEFKEALENAFELIKHTSGNKVHIKKHRDERK